MSQNLAMILAVPESVAEASSLVVSKAISARTPTTPMAAVKPTAVVVLIVDMVLLVTVDTMLAYLKVLLHNSTLSTGCQ